MVPLEYELLVFSCKVTERDKEEDSETKFRINWLESTKTHSKFKTLKKKIESLF